MIGINELPSQAGFRFPELLNDATNHSASSTIPADFPVSVAEPILGGLEDAAHRLSKAMESEYNVGRGSLLLQANHS